MRAQDKKIRNSLRYKIKMWFFRLEFWEVVCFFTSIGLFLLEVIMSGIGFFLLFIVPNLFH